MDQKTIWESQRVHGAVVIVLVLLAGFLFAQTIKAFKEYRFVGGGVPISNTITVSGEGEAFGTPDVAEFTFSIIEKGTVVKDVQAAATQKANAAKNYLHEQGVEDKDIKTVGYYVSPPQPPIECYGGYCPPRNADADKFTVTETVSVKVREVDTAGTLVSGVGTVGAKEISGVTFAVDDPDSITAEARQKAIDDAKGKAKVLADQLGVSLVRIVSFNEGGNYPVPYYAKGGVAMDMAVAESAPAPELSPGENKVVSSVSITYEIR